MPRALEQGSTSRSSGMVSLLATRARARTESQIAQWHAAFGQVHADPVVRQARPGQHQLAGLELPIQSPTNTLP